MKYNNMWFNVRRSLFLVLFPILLGIATFSGYISQDSESGNNYSNLYVYTWLVLFIHRMLINTLDYLFTLCSDEFIIVPSLDKESHNFIVNHKRMQFIYLKYSNNKLIQHIMKICWYIGYNAPIYISNDVLHNVINEYYNVNNHDEIDNLDKFLSKLINHTSKLYELVPIGDDNIETNTSNQRVLSKIDNEVALIKTRIFGERNDKNFEAVIMV